MTSAPGSGDTPAALTAPSSLTTSVSAPPLLPLQSSPDAPATPAASNQEDTASNGSGGSGGEHKIAESPSVLGKRKREDNPVEAAAMAAASRSGDGHGSVNGDGAGMGDQGVSGGTGSSGGSAAAGASGGGGDDAKSPVGDPGKGVGRTHVSGAADATEPADAEESPAKRPRLLAPAAEMPKEMVADVGQQSRLDQVAPFEVVCAR